MKKTVFIITMLLAVISVSAQGEWKKSVIEADELKGIEGGVFYEYQVEGMGSLILWGWDTFQYRLISDHQFNIDSGGGFSGVFVHVGIYDDNNVLKEKFDMWLDREGNRANRFVRTRNAGGMSNPIGQKRKVKKIFKALQSNSGYVRMVAERFQRTDFDIKITPYKE